MEGLEVTWKRVLSVWWCVTWRMLVVFLLIIVASGIVGAVMAIVALGLGSRLPPSMANIVGGVIGFLGAGLGQLVVLRMALRKNYRDFRIVLVPRNPN